MFDSLLILVTATFLLAGFVKGALGLGLPTVSMGLLAVSMPPAQAIAIVIVPAIVTNIWQTFGGPYLRDIFRRRKSAHRNSLNGVVSLAKPPARRSSPARLRNGSSLRAATDFGISLNCRRTPLASYG